MLGSRFGWRCGRDRAANLKKLLVARDPCLRTAASVYLSFEDEDAGREALRASLMLPGAPGGWAALTLARRGGKDAVPRAIQAMDQDEPSRLRINVCQGLRVLLSNTAAASGRPQPPRLDLDSPDDRPARITRFREACEAWWGEHGANTTLTDPWLPLCVERKID